MSIHRTKSGTYRVRWRESGRLQSRNFRRKVDADRFEASVLLGESVIHVSGNGLTFGELAKIWMRDYASVHKTPSSILPDDALLRNQLLPSWTERRIDQISQQDIDRLQVELLSQSLSPKTVNLVTGLLAKILKDGVRWGYLKVNPANHLRRLKINDTWTQFWSFDELDRFLVFAKRSNQELHDLVLFAAHTGLRKGEIAGLTRECLDYDFRRIIVKRSYCKHTQVLNEYTKGKRVRIVPMNELVWKLMQSKRLLAPTQRVFEGDFDHASRLLRRVAKEAGVKPIRFHDLRHTFGSLLGMSGTSPFMLKEMMGHSDMKITLRYTHIDPVQLAGATDTLVPGKRRLHPSPPSEQVTSASDSFR